MVGTIEEVSFYFHYFLQLDWNIIDTKHRVSSRCIMWWLPTCRCCKMFATVKFMNTRSSQRVPLCLLRAACRFEAPAHGRFTGSSRYWSPRSPHCTEVPGNESSDHWRSVPCAQHLISPAPWRQPFYSVPGGSAVFRFLLPVGPRRPCLLSTQSPQAPSMMRTGDSFPSRGQITYIHICITHPPVGGSHALAIVNNAGTETPLQDSGFSSFG